MERAEFLDFVRCYPLMETLCGNGTPVLTEFEYARIYSSESKEWIKVPGNTLIIMFSAINSFSINSPLTAHTEFKYCFNKKQKDHLNFCLKFLDDEIKRNIVFIGDECLKIVGEYQIIKNVMVFIKSREQMYDEMDCKINKMFLA